MHHRNMFGLFKGCRLARMSSGRYCVVRDLGLVKGGKGMRHHEVVVAFSVRELFKWLRQPSVKRFEPEAVGWADRDMGEPRDSSPPTPPYVRVRRRRFDRLSSVRYRDSCNSK